MSMRFSSLNVYFVMRTIIVAYFLNVDRYFKAVQLATLTFFLTVTPLFDVFVQMIACVDLITDVFGEVSFRAFYFAEVECYQSYQIVTIVIFFFIIISLFCIMTLHYLRNIGKFEDNETTAVTFSVSLIQINFFKFQQDAQ